MPKKKYKIASLFSGCGGLDLGFAGGFTFLGKDYNRLNTEIVFANDFDVDACKCYNANPLLVNDGAECLLDVQWQRLATKVANRARRCLV